MIPVIEDFVIETIQNNLGILKTTPSRLDKILNIPSDKLSNLKAILDTIIPIKVIKGYPRTNADLPCICLLLDTEEESQSSLGDIGCDDLYQNESEMVTPAVDIVTVVNTKGGRMSLPYFELSKKPVYSIDSVSVVDSGYTYDRDYYTIQSPELGIVSIDDTTTPHGTRLSVSYNYESTYGENVEVLYESSYNIEVWSQNGDFTSDLYHLVKWALLSGRDYLQSSVGLLKQKLKGTNFNPAPAFFPEFVYRRGLIFWCQYLVSAPMEDVPYISNVEVNETIVFDTDNGGVDNVRV